MFRHKKRLTFFITKSSYRPILDLDPAFVQNDRKLQIEFQTRAENKRGEYQS